VQWGIIYGFPGESAANYAEMIAIMPRIAHLEPPNAAHRILIDRYSPYYKDPAGLGINAVSPFETYRALYPPDVPTEDVAYHFDGHYSTGLLDSPDLVARLHEAVAQWREAYHGERRPMLQIATAGNAALVVDTRPIAQAPMTPLTPGQHAALTELERPKSLDALDPAMAEDARWLVERDFVIVHEGKAMSVVVRPRPHVAAIADGELLAAE
jgi:hypothetical protein